MKKAVCGIFMALFLVSSVNFTEAANTNHGCFNFADNTATWVGAMFNMSHLEEHNYVLYLYDKCLENQN